MNISAYDILLAVEVVALSAHLSINADDPAYNGNNSLHVHVDNHSFPDITSIRHRCIPFKLRAAALSYVLFSVYGSSGLPGILFCRNSPAERGCRNRYCTARIS